MGLDLLSFCLTGVKCWKLGNFEFVPSNLNVFNTVRRIGQLFWDPTWEFSCSSTLIIFVNRIKEFFLWEFLCSSTLIIFVNRIKEIFLWEFSCFSTHVVPTSWLNYLRRQFVFVCIFSLYTFVCSLFTLCFFCIFSRYTFVCSLFTLCLFYSLSLYVWTY